MAQNFRGVVNQQPQNAQRYAGPQVPPLRQYAGPNFPVGFFRFLTDSGLIDHLH